MKIKNCLPIPMKQDYQSPVRILMDDMQRTIEKKTDDYVLEQIRLSVGVEVDRDELLKALHYDRQQYTKGFDDGYVQGVEAGRILMLEKLKEFVHETETK